MNRLAYALFLLAILCVLPFAVLSFYSHPALDDYALSVFLRTTKLLPHVWNAYLTHSGRYGSSLASFVFILHSAHPAWYSYQIFAFVSLFALGLFGAATALATGPRLGRQGLLPGSVVLIAGFSAFPWPAEGLFWLTGAQAYLTSLILGSWLLVLLAHLYAAPKATWHPLGWGLSALLSFLIPGFSEVWAIALPLVGGALLVVSPLPNRRAVYWVVGAGLAGCIATLAAPGNFHRLHQGHGAGLHVGSSLVQAVFGTGYLLVNWLSNGLLLILTALLWPVYRLLAHYPGRSLLNRLTTHWLLWPAVLVAGMGAALFFCYLATGIGPALRVKNMLYFYFLFCWFLGAYAVARRYGPPVAAWEWPRAWRYGLGIGLGCFFLTDHNTTLRHEGIGRGASTVVQAYRDWLSGDAARYDAAQLARYQQMRAAAPGGRVVLPALPVLPQTLFYYDISYNPALWGNVAYAQFFGLQQVWVQPPNEPAP
ncbi:MAG: DUF6056 family protein [Janthinobacterium lividum]